MTDSTPSTKDARFSDLVALMARLRSPEGCPWDREQDHRSLRHCLLEETYEVLEAVDRDDADALCQELGDILLQVLFHAQLAAEAGRFTIEDVLQALHDKLVGRHPHVFGDTSLETAEEVLREWQALKHRERGQMGNDPIGDVPRNLPALSRAQVVQQRAARAGIARSEEETRGALEQALAQLAEGPSGGRRTEQALGELLLAAVDLARARGIDAEQALRERVDDILAARRQTESERAAPEHRA
jgi:tetrapyrrole methylase family protein/MazG family protein